MQTDAVEPGTRLADRYRLDEVLLRGGGATTWRAVDEVLNRTVAVVVLPAQHPRADAVVAAARAAAAVADPRFLRVFDASSADGVVYVVKEWVPGRNLAELLADGPLRPVEAADLVHEVAAALARAHDHGLAHLQLSPAGVVRTDGGHLRIVGLAVDAALEGDSPDARAPNAAERDAHGLGAVLYAALTGRWPDDAEHGLPAAPREEGRLCTPRQVRAGVPPGLDEVVMGALTLSDGIVPADRRLASPAAVAAALVAQRRRSAPAISPIRRETPLDREDSTTVGLPATREEWSPWPRRLTGVVKGLVALTLLLGAGLLGWQIATGPLGSGSDDSAGNSPTPAVSTGGPAGKDGGRVDVAGVTDFDPLGDGGEHPDEVGLAVDGDPSTAWTTLRYDNRPDLGGLKPGVGIVLDLGSSSPVRTVTLDLLGEGTSLELRAAPDGTDGVPETVDGFRTVASADDAGTRLTLTPTRPVQTRFVLVWLTSLPPEGPASYRGGVEEAVVRR